MTLFSMDPFSNCFGLKNGAARPMDQNLQKNCSAKWGMGAKAKVG